METKDTDIFIWTIYSYVVQQPEHDWLMEADKDSFVNIWKFMKNLALPLVCCCHSFIQSQFVIRYVLKQVVLEQTALGIPPFNMIVELGSSNK